MAKMTEQEDTGLTIFHRHTKITTIYTATTNDTNMKISRKDLLQLKI